MSRHSCTIFSWCSKGHAASAAADSSPLNRFATPSILVFSATVVKNRFSNHPFIGRGVACTMVSDHVDVLVQCIRVQRVPLASSTASTAVFDK